jgi:hypothetical protein
MMVTQRLEEQTSQPGISKEIKIKDISEDSQLNPNLLSWESIIQSIEDKRQLCEYLEEQNRQLSHENILLKIDMKRINEIALKGEEFHVLKNLLQRIANSQITNEITQLENEGFKNIG